MQTRPVFRSLNKPMTLLGVERRMFFFVLIVAFLLFQLSDTLMPAVVLFVILRVGARGLTQADPQLMRVLMNSTRFQSRYDPALKPEEVSQRG